MSPSKTDVPTVCAVFGKEEFLKRQAVSALVARAMAGGSDDGPTRVDGNVAELADALDAVRTYSLLGGRRIAIVDQADKFITKYRSKLEDYAKDPVADACLILVCESMPKNTRLYKTIAAGGQVVECNPLRAYEAPAWAVQRCRDQYRKTIDRPAADKLVDLVGADLGTLDSELEKLSVYVGSAQGISLDDVQALVGQHREEMVFRVTDAIGAGDAAAALRAWDQVWATDRAAPVRAIGGLAYGIRQMLSAKESGSTGGRGAPGYVKNTNLSAEELKAQLCDLMEVDLAAKTGLADVNTCIQTFIVKHATKRVARTRRPAGASK